MRARALVLTLGLLMAVAPASGLAAGGDVSGAGADGIGTLAPVGSVPDAAATATPGGDAAAVDGGIVVNPDPLDDDATSGTLRQIQQRAADLERQLLAAQAELARLERDREAADSRLDATLQAYAVRLVDLYDAGASARIQQLIAARDAVDAVERDDLLATMHAADQAVVTAHGAAAARAAAAAAAAEAARAEVLSLGTALDAVESAIEARRAPDAAERARDRGERFSIDADHVFATGAIPGIGYWGKASGGGMLTGWTGMVAASVGGVGCEPPSPSLRGTGSVERGDASWYGPGFHGQGTASGEVYDQQAMTAAHRTLPFGTVVRVYSSTTARCAFVRINDRGPFVDGRIIDLSKAAADAVGLPGVGPVQLEVWADSTRPALP